jgi:protein-disulfide isomerase
VAFLLALAAGFLAGREWNQRQRSQPVALAQGERLRLELRGDEPAQGPAEALVTIVAFSDFECPFCARASEPLLEVVDDFQPDVRLVFKHYPLPFHPLAMPAAKAAWAAHQQQAFWEMHDWLFREGAKSWPQAPRQALALGLDPDRLRDAMLSPEAEAVIRKDQAAGRAIGINSTPSFVVNGHHYSGVLSEADWEKILLVELEAAQKLVDQGVPRSEVYPRLMPESSPPPPETDRPEVQPKALPPASTSTGAAPDSPEPAVPEP